MTDLYGEGLPGILIEDQNAWYFKQNLGDENYYKDLPANLLPVPEARLGSVRQIRQKPSFANNNGSYQITDVDGDGTQDLLINTPDIKGYYARSSDGEWLSFRPFVSNPNINWEDPNLRLIDVDGDGFADILITEENCFTCYPSQAEEGYAEAYKTLKAFDEEEGPAIVFADANQSVYLADMTGDGLVDIVRIQNGAICYWPNMGYGRFGRKVTMNNSPWFDHDDIFSQQRVRLADVDGSGTTDIIYIAEEEVRYYPNFSGNQLGDAVLINQRLPTHNLAGIATIDLLGNGTQCLVWSSPVEGDHPPALKFIDLMGGTKPYLLTEVNNNMGSITRLKYAPSTKFYLRDQREGKPWITKLSFPVHVVERVEVWDEVNRNRFVTKYAYHHGYFDGPEREFRGFGMVEQWDTETFTDFTNEGLFPPGYNASEEVLHVPPVHTKTWFHTGFHQEGEKILGQYEQEYWSGDSEAVALNRTLQVLDQNGNALQARPHHQELREAARALKGSPLRQEIYSLDGSPEQVHPYVVTENSYHLHRVQPRANTDRKDRDYASFLTIPSETLAFQYERNPSDPRISHQLVLETDQYGTAIKSAAVGYARRASAGYAQQDITLITVSENTVTHVDNDPDFYRLAVPVESKAYELTGLRGAGAYPGQGNNVPGPTSSSPAITVDELLDAYNIAAEISFEAIPDGTLQKRLIDRSRVLYYDETLNTTTPLAFGQVASHGLPFESYRLALTPGLLSGVLNDTFTRVDNTILGEGKYQDLLSDGHQWAPSGKVIFDNTHFYLPTAQIDAFGNQSTIQYDGYHLLLTQATDAVGNTTIAQHDYRLLQPDLVTDPNGNRQAFAFDVRGMVTAMAVMGKTTESEGNTLADPTITFEYDLFRWMDQQLPNYAKTRARESHSLPDTRWQESYAYSNGLGQVIMTKTIAAPGDAFSRDANGDLLRDANGDLIMVNSDPRWAASGRTILDNKGNPVKQYEPYYSSTFEYESEAELVEYGVTPVIHYDPLGRAIRTELPDNTITKVTFDPWQQASHDQNDTVLESLWYIERNNPDPAGSEPTDADERAAWLAAKHAGTPQVVHFDALGRSFLTIDDNATDGLYQMTTELDIQGNPLSITDAKGRQSFTYIYNLLNQPLKTTHLDNGTRYAIGNVAGKPLRAWDSRSQAFRFKYDALQRPTHTFLTIDYDLATPGAEKLITLTIFGERKSNPEGRNLRGQVYLIYDSSGLTENTRFDFKGNLLIGKRQMALEYQNVPDWSSLDGITSGDTVLTNSQALLEAEKFTTSTYYDALNRPRDITLMDSSRFFPVYNEGGQLQAISTRVRGATPAVNFVQSITYNARGQREKILYGNNAQTTYAYDSHTFRLTRLRTTRNSGSDVLQDLNYTYDPVGNIVALRNDAQQTIFFNNTQVDPHAKYTYDALYRLLSAEGREFVNNNAAPGPGDIAINPLPDTNTSALRLYNQSYEYDELGNIMKMIHQATGGNWTRHYHYDTNNYLLGTSNDGIAPSPAQYTYDTHGNMTAMPHLPTMSWDYADRLHSADLGGGGITYYAYDAGGDRARKVIENGNIKEERIYLGAWEVYRKYVNGTLDTERESLHIMDDTRRIALVETLTVDNGIAVTTPTPLHRYQLTNHLDSATLELDSTAAIISYEEYYPFGSSSYRSGRNNAETSLKRYRYVGKERDDETGLYYYGARYYASWLARFVSVDPLKDDYPYYTSYQYAGNKPINNIDLDGLEPNPKTDTGGQGKKQTELKKLEEAKPGDLVDLGNGEGALMLDEVVITPDPLEVEIDLEKKLSYKNEIEEAVVTGTGKGTEEAGKRAGSTADDIEESMRKKGILRTNKGRNVQGKVVKKQIKQIGVSGREEIVTESRGQHRGTGVKGETTKGAKTPSTKISRTFKGIARFSEAFSTLGGYLDYGILAKGFVTGDIEDVINAAPLGLITQSQIEQFEEVRHEVSLKILNLTIPEGAKKTDEFLRKAPELDLRVVFLTASELEGVLSNKIKDIGELQDPFYNNLEYAIITSNSRFKPLMVFKNF